MAAELVKTRVLHAKDGRDFLVADFTVAGNGETHVIKELSKKNQIDVEEAGTDVQRRLFL